MKEGPEPCAPLGLLALLCVGLISTRAWSKELALASFCSPCHEYTSLVQHGCQEMGGEDSLVRCPCPLLPPSPGTSGLCEAGSTQFCITLSLPTAQTALLGK